MAFLCADIDEHLSDFHETLRNRVDICFVLAEGKIDIIIESGLKQVDILPLVPIIKKAGGLIVNWEGKNDLSKGQIIACSNKKLLYNFLNYFHSNY